MGLGAQKQHSERWSKVLRMLLLGEQGYTVPLPVKAQQCIHQRLRFAAKTVGEYAATPRPERSGGK